MSPLVNDETFMPLNLLPLPELSDGDIIRLWAGVKLGGKDACWLWKKCQTRAGYGLLRLSGRQYIVTRIMWKHWHGVDPGELLVCHNCHNPPCCNPNHLFLGTHSENVHDKFNSGRQSNAGQLHPQAKLSVTDVRIIRERLDNGDRQIDIAQDFGVTNSAICAIKNGRRWIH